MNLRLMVCTRCWAEDIPDCNPSLDPTAQGLATVHTDKRPPGPDNDAVYVTPHKRDCPTLNRVINEERH